MSSILSDQEAVENVKGSTKERYLKIWTSFKDNSPNSAEYESRTPKENELLDFFILLFLKQYVDVLLYVECCYQRKIWRTLAKVSKDNFSTEVL